MEDKANANQTRLRLLEAASAEILEKGYAGASLSNIAARLGYTKGSLGYHFPTKETLLDALVDQLAETDRIAAYRAHKAFADSPARALLAHVASFSFATTTDVVTAASSLLVYDPSIPLLYGRQAYEVWFDRVSAYVREAAELEGYELEVSPEEAAQRILVTIAGGLITSRFVADDGERPRLAYLGPTLRSLPFPDTDDLIADVRASGFFHTSNLHDL